MTRTAELLSGVLLAGIVYVLALWWFMSALGTPAFPTLLSIVLAVPPIVAGWIAFRRNPKGRWWIVPTIAVVVTSAVVLSAIYIILSGSGEV